MPTGPLQKRLRPAGCHAGLGQAWLSGNGSQARHSPIPFPPGGIVGIINWQVNLGLISNAISIWCGGGGAERLEPAAACVRGCEGAEGSPGVPRCARKWVIVGLASFPQALGGSLTPLSLPTHHTHACSQAEHPTTRPVLLCISAPIISGLCYTHRFFHVQEGALVGNRVLQRSCMCLQGRRLGFPCVFGEGGPCCPRCGTGTGTQAMTQAKLSPAGSRPQPP